jgi:hypothetical protein
VRGETPGRYLSLAGEAWEAIIKHRRADGTAAIDVMLDGRVELELDRVPLDETRTERGTWSGLRAEEGDA